MPSSPKGKSRWEPFICRLTIEEIDTILVALKATTPGVPPSPDRPPWNTKLARQLVADLEATRSDLWRYLP